MLPLHPNLRLTSPKVTIYTMAKSRVTTNPMYVGGAGGYSFYVRGGEQVIRQRKNNSNYGEGASRTMAQMIRRIRWGNLVNVFKSQKAWQPKAYDSKTKGQTDYNIFMSLNINQATAGLTKEMCLAGCAVIEGYQVSRGSLPPIALSPSQSGNQYVTDIKITNAISGSSTVGQLSADILANNSQFSEGDNIAFIFFKNWLTSRTEWPYASSVYTEITLDSTSATVINSIPSLDNRLSKSTGGFLQVSWSSTGQFDPTREVGFVIIHTRKSASMLAVSSQEILMNSNSLVAQFSGATWDATCINSYGLSDEVPLGPSFPEASISSVTANGSAVQNAQVLQGSQELHILGSDLLSSNIRVTLNDEAIIPLSSSDDDLMYIVSCNAVVKIYAGNILYMTVIVNNVTTPEGLPANMSFLQVPTTTTATTQEGRKNVVTLYDILYFNYPYVADAECPYFLYVIGAELTQEMFECHNCTINSYSDTTAGQTKLNLSPVDASKPCYITVEGTVVAVFNYTA